MAKTAYIGIPTAFPVYKEETKTIAITAANVAQYFTVTNGSYYFAGSGNVFTSNNGGVNSSEATTTLTAKVDISALTFRYSYSSEQKYDKFTLTVGGTTVESAVSGATTTKSYSGSLKAGQSIVLTYAKDSSQSNNDDKCTISNISITAKVRTQTGTETKPVARKVKRQHMGVNGVARKVKRGLIGVSGVARLCFEGGTPITTKAVGDIVQVAENGSPVDYIVVQIGTPNTDYYQNADGYWLLRKNVDSTLSGYYNYTHYNRDDYDDNIADYTTATKENDIQPAEQKYFARYGEKLKSTILSPTLPFCQGYNNPTQITVKNVFHVGAYEINLFSGDCMEGYQAVLEYFKNAASRVNDYHSNPDGSETLRVARDENGITRPWFTRDIVDQNSSGAKVVDAWGWKCWYPTAYYRPCIIVPKTAKLEDLLS